MKQWLILLFHWDKTCLTCSAIVAISSTNCIVHQLLVSIKAFPSQGKKIPNVHWLENGLLMDTNCRHFNFGDKDTMKNHFRKSTEKPLINQFWLFKLMVWARPLIGFPGDWFDWECQLFSTNLKASKSCLTSTYFICIKMSVYDTIYQKHADIMSDLVLGIISKIYNLFIYLKKFTKVWKLGFTVCLSF